MPTRSAHAWRETDVGGGGHCVPCCIESHGGYILVHPRVHEDIYSVVHTRDRHTYTRQSAS